MNERINIFLSYSHLDEKFRDEISKHLNLLERKGYISCWDDRKILAGEEWNGKIIEYLNSAQIILLLISPDFITSNYIWNVEIKIALDRQNLGTAKVIPIILKPVDWNDLPTNYLQVLPSNSKPISMWENIDAAFLDAAQGIKKVVMELVTSKKKTFSHENTLLFKKACFMHGKNQSGTIIYILRMDLMANI